MDGSEDCKHATLHMIIIIMIFSISNCYSYRNTVRWLCINLARQLSMDRCFLDLQPSSHWGRRNHLAWFPQPLLWPFGSEFCFRTASQQKSLFPSKNSKSFQESLNKMRSSGQAQPFLSFLCSTIFLTWFNSILFPTLLLVATAWLMGKTW